MIPPCFLGSLSHRTATATREGRDTLAHSFFRAGEYARQRLRSRGSVAMSRFACRVAHAGYARRQRQRSLLGVRSEGRRIADAKSGLPFNTRPAAGDEVGRLGAAFGLVQRSKICVHSQLYEVAFQSTRRGVRISAGRFEYRAPV